jgi:phosphoglycolate phosphatase
MNIDFTKLCKPKAILFDWDNTLTHSWPVMQHAINSTLQHFNQPIWTLDEVKLNIGLSMKDAFPKLFGEKWQEAGNVYYRKYLEMRETYLASLPDSEEMLIYLNKYSDIFVGIVSNKRGHALREEVEMLGWQAYFDIAIGSQDAQRDKPEPEPVILALKDTGIETKDVWFIGDSDVDIVCANNTGCTPILFGDNALVLQTMPDVTNVADHRQLIELIKTHF